VRPRIHRVDLAGEAAVQQVCQYDMPDLAGLTTGTDHGDGSWPQQRQE
jgi:hypothetical protein